MVGPWGLPARPPDGTLGPPGTVKGVCKVLITVTSVTVIFKAILIHLAHLLTIFTLLDAFSIALNDARTKLEPIPPATKTTQTAPFHAAPVKSTAFRCLGTGSLTAAIYPLELPAAWLRGALWPST